MANVHVDKAQDYCDGYLIVILDRAESRPALRMMLTHPEYQGRGLASIMLRHILERIDREGRRCYLESTPAVYPLYLKFGWRVVDEIKTNLAKYGVHTEASSLARA